MQKELYTKPKLNINRTPQVFHSCCKFCNVCKFLVLFYDLILIFYAKCSSVFLWKLCDISFNYYWYYYYSIRYVTVLYYLNDVEEGGETAFPMADNTTRNMEVRCWSGNKEIWWENLCCIICGRSNFTFSRECVNRPVLVTFIRILQGRIRVAA